GGLYNKENSTDQEGESLTLTPWGDLKFIDQNEGTYTFTRIGSFPVELHAKGKLGTIRVVRDIDDFDKHDLLGAKFSIAVKFADGSPETYHLDRKSTRLNSSHVKISYAVFCLKQKTTPVN